VIRLKTWDQLLRGLYEEWINIDLDEIKSIHGENKDFQRIRERCHENWKTVEMCRELLFENVKLIKFLSERIQDVRGKIKELRSI
jgi:hypothetical protein